MGIAWVGIAPGGNCLGELCRDRLSRPWGQPHLAPFWLLPMKLGHVSVELQSAQGSFWLGPADPAHLFQGVHLCPDPAV